MDPLLRHLQRAGQSAEARQGAAAKEVPIVERPSDALDHDLRAIRELPKEMPTDTIAIIRQLTEPVYHRAALRRFRIDRDLTPWGADRRGGRKRVVAEEGLEPPTQGL